MSSIMVLFPFARTSRPERADCLCQQLGHLLPKRRRPGLSFGGTGPLISTTVFEGLVDMGWLKQRLSALVAKAWKIAPDWSYIDFDLKPGIKFHNGGSPDRRRCEIQFRNPHAPGVKTCPGLCLPCPGSKTSKSSVLTRSVSISKCRPLIYVNASGGTGLSC